MVIHVARALSLSCFIIVYSMILYIGHKTDFDGKSGTISIFSGVLLAAFFAGMVWTRIIKGCISVEEKLKITIVFVIFAISMDFIRIIMLSTYHKALSFLPVLMIAHIAIGGFIILGGLHSANKVFLLKDRFKNPVVAREE